MLCNRTLLRSSQSRQRHKKRSLPRCAGGFLIFCCAIACSLSVATHAIPQTSHTPPSQAGSPTPPPDSTSQNPAGPTASDPSCAPSLLKRVCSQLNCDSPRDTHDCSQPRANQDCERCLLFAFDRCAAHGMDPACIAQQKANADAVSRCETAKALQNAQHENERTQCEAQAALNKQLCKELTDKCPQQPQ
jgi:hypothetical protein